MTDSAAEHITTVPEIREAGLVLSQAKRSHVIRVLGARREVTHTPLTLHEEYPLPPEAHAAYTQGSIQGEQEDLEQNPRFPRVPSLFVTASGEAVFLKRGDLA